MIMPKPTYENLSFSRKTGVAVIFFPNGRGLRVHRTRIGNTLLLTADPVQGDINKFVMFLPEYRTSTTNPGDITRLMWEIYDYA